MLQGVLLPVDNGMCCHATACCRGLQPTSTETSSTLLAGLGGEAGGAFAGTDLRVDLGAGFLRVLGAAELGAAPADGT